MYVRKINSVNYYHYPKFTPNFKATLVQNSDYIEYTENITDVEKNYFNSLNEMLNKVNDGRQFIYNTYMDNGKKMARILEIINFNGKEYNITKSSLPVEKSKVLFEMLYVEYLLKEIGNIIL